MSRTSVRHKVWSIILALVILSVLGMIGYNIASPKVGQRLTESYILGSEGKSADYPTEVAVGETGSVIVGIVNREYETVRYWLEVRIDGIRNNEVGEIVLEHNEKWEQEVSFTPQKAGANQRVEFLLYKNGEAKPYLEPLRLWVDVTE